MPYGLLVVDGVNRQDVLLSTFSFLGGRWSELDSKESDLGWRADAVHVRNMCVRSQGAFGFVKIHFECKDLYVLDKLRKPSSQRILSEKIKSLPYADSDGYLPIAIPGAGYFDQDRNVRVEVMPAKKPMADKNPDLGHLVVETSPVDRVLDLAKLSGVFRSLGLNILQHEGALRSDGKRYKYGFRILYDRPDEEGEYHEIKVDIAEALKRVLDIAGNGLEIYTELRSPDRTFQSAFDAYGVRRGSRPEEKPYLYAFAQAEDWKGGLSSISEFYATYGLKSDTSPREIVRSTCRVLDRVSTVLLCLEPANADLSGEVDYGACYQELQGSDYSGKVFAQYAVLHPRGPWSIADDGYEHECMVGFRAHRAHEHGKTRRIFRDLTHKFGSDNVDFVEADSWCARRPRKNEEGEDPVVYLQSCLTVQSAKGGKAVLSGVRRVLERNGWEVVAINMIPFMRG